MTGDIIVGGYYMRVKKPPQLTVFENKMADTSGHAIPSFFSSTKEKKKKNQETNADSQV